MNGPPSRSDVEAFRLMRAGRLEEALKFAERAVAGARECLPAHGLLATLLLKLGRSAQADALIEGALALGGSIADAYDGLAFVSIQMGHHDRANALYRRATELAPGEARFHYNLATSERSLGRLIEAETACNRAIALDPRHYPSYLLRSEMRKQDGGSNHVDELLRRLSGPDADDRARMFLGYALGKELDDLERFDEAFRWFVEGARTRRHHLAYDVAVDEQKLRRIAEVFSSIPPASCSNSPDARNYVFIVGLPRSGTTLLERILTGHRGVRSNGETDNFSRSLLAATPAGAGDVFARAAAADTQRVAAGYARLAGGDAGETIIEKLPLNYLYLGPIHRALPEARLLHVHRNPLDSCFAMFRTLFGEGYPFSYDLQDLARYYAAYRRLLQHWRDVLGERVTDVSYEHLVRDPAVAGEQVAKVCGITWNPAAVVVEKNAAVSWTASAAQVRRPIYGTSSGRWRHYRVHLEPLIGALRAQGVELDEDA